MAPTTRSPVLFFLASLLICAGCRRDAEPESAAQDGGVNIEDQIQDDQGSSVKERIEAALAAAQGDGKRVLLVFGGDWCPDCLALDRIFAEQPAMAVLASGYHVVKIDVGRRDRNLDVVDRYDNPIAGGLPAVVILDGTGQVLVATNQGELATARSMPSSEVLAFLRRWAPGNSHEPNGER